MDWVRLHLMVNHFPIILGVTGGLAAIAAAIARSDTLWKYAAITALLAALTSPVAYFSGTAAEETVEHAWYADHEQVEEHEETGLFALIALLAAGATAVAALWRPRGATRGTFLVVTVAAVGITAYAALEGGEIVHDSPALRAGPAAAATGEAAEAGESAERQGGEEEEEEGEGYR